MIVKRLIFFIVEILMIIHDCTCLPSHKLSANITKRQIVPMGCDYSSNCKYYEWCVRKKCEWACIDRMDCESWSTDGHCVALNNSGYCRFYSSTALSDLFDTSDPSEIKRGIKEAGSYCTRTDDCAPHLYCHTDSKCTDPCEKLVKCVTFGFGNPGFIVSSNDFRYETSHAHRCLVQDYTLRCV